jgi:hypothetical protein
MGTAVSGINQKSITAPPTAADPNPAAPTTTEPRKTEIKITRFCGSMIVLPAPMATIASGPKRLQRIRKPCHLTDDVNVIGSTPPY